MSFSRQIKKFVAKTKKDTDDVVKEIFLNLSTRIIERTPIGDPTSWQSPAPKTYEAGTLKNSWYSGIGETPLSLDVRSPSTTGADARNNAFGTASKVVGNIAYIANPAPYAFRIEFDSWSPQAEAGMVRITLQEFDQIVRQAVNGVN